MKKNIAKIIAISALATVTTVATVSSAIAWYTGKAVIDTNDGINGSSQGAYFAGGDGTKDSPFKITNKWHMYNLAWLTYIGWFDSDDGWGQDKEVKQPYFILEGENNTIDMEGLVIPPIGTSAHPFKGNFNGNDNVIINFGISNKMTAAEGDGGITRKPTTVAASLSNIDIVGLFGVVGLLPENSTANYSSSINKLYDFGCDDFTVQTQNSTNGNLVGLAAGYVNATMSGVSVGNCALDIASGTHLLNKNVEVVNSANVKPSYISHYSTVGYATTGFRSVSNDVDIKTEVPNVKNGSSAGSGNVFGASIPMQNIYQHLKDVKGTYNAQDHRYEYVSKEINYYNNSGTLVNSIKETSIAPASSYSYGNVKYSFSGPTEEDTNGYQIASYNLANRNDRDDFIYLDGKRTGITISNGKQVQRYDQVSGTAYYIYDSNGHYLGLSGTTLTNVSEANAVPFVYTSGNYLTTNISGTTYYLYSGSTGSLTLSNSTYNRTTWTLDGTTFYNASRGYIVYVNGSWTTKASLTDTVYYIYDGENYLCCDGGDLYNGNEDEKTGWIYEDNLLSVTQDGTTYYLYSGDEGELDTYTYYNYATEWTLTSNRFRNSSVGYIVYDEEEDAWITSSSLNPNKNLGWTISKGTNYVGLDGTTLTNVSSSEAAHFTANNAYLYATINGSTYYFTRTGFIASTSNRLTRSSATATSSYFSSRARNGNRYTYYYLDYSSNSWRTQTITNNNSNYYRNLPALTFTQDFKEMDYSGVTSTYTTINYSSLIKNGEAYQYTSSSTTNATYDTNQTYFPLKFTDDYSDIAYNNTGYIVGGSNFATNAQILSGTFDAMPGDIRVSSYSFYQTNTSSPHDLRVASNSGRSYDGSRFEIITKTSYSASKISTNGGYVRISDGYNKNNTSVSSSISGYTKLDVKTLGLKKYTTARDYFHNTLTQSPSNIYGLHFMNAQISETRLVTVERAMANGWEYLPDGTANHYVVRTDSDGYPVDITGKRTNDSKKYVYDKVDEDTKNIGAKYTLPQDCIDFNLSENGTINFFAGSYFGGNEAFFSLHRIFRNDNEVITDIKEILKVYNNNAYNSVTNPNVPRYIYEYTDNTYSATAAAGSVVIGDVLFDTTWITSGMANYMIENAAYYFEIPAIPGEYALGSVSGHNGAYLMYLDIGASEESNDIVIVEEKVTTKTDSYVFPTGVDFVVLTTGETTSYTATQGGEIGTVIIPNGTSGNNISFTLANKILTCGPPTAGSITQSTFIADGATIKCGSTNLTEVKQATTTKVEEITTKWTFDAENETLYKDVTTVTSIDGGTGESVVSPQTSTAGITQEMYEGTMKIKITEGSTATYVEFWYEVPQGSEVTVTYEYTYNPSTDKYTYVFTVTSTSGEVVIHVLSIQTGYYVAFKGINEAGTGYDTYNATAGGTVTIREGVVSSGS